MPFKTLIQKMTQAAVRGDGPGVAACFCENGIYHDVFYGEFRGNAIINLIEGHFHRDGKDFQWDLYDAIEQNGIDMCSVIHRHCRKPRIGGRLSKGWRSAGSKRGASGNIARLLTR